ncbi:serine protease family S09X [Thraustotheca clavata]|uniref:Serine protease family S09X n=1 Tax=Thraustotheca clavata TaxID=74557 RepID=A0A1V9YYC0_9STRA|nr:serine protease family S09X [Thraustotheca clavata]
MTESNALTTVLGWMQSMVYAGGALFATSLMLLYVYQEKLLYHPSMPGVPKLTTDNPKGYRHPGEYGIDFEDVYIPTKDGITIHAWLLKQANMKQVPTIVFFHGNAGNIGFRLPNAVQMYRMLGCNIVMVDYRGFGLSLGTPTEKGLQMDAEATIDYLSMRQDLDNTKFIAFGRSLGGAVAIYLGEARSDKIAAIIVENTFLSISTMVDSLMPWLSYIKRYVLAIDWSNERRIPSLAHPILFLSGQKDELVPPFHMTKLHDIATQSKLRKWYPIARGTHNDSWVQGGAPYFDAMRAFIERICEMTLENNKKKTDEQVCADGQEIPNMLDSTLFQHVKPKDKDV